MATTLKLLAQAALTTTDATVYTVPAATTTVIKSISVCNTDTVIRTVTIHAVAPGGSSMVANILVAAMPIGIGETVFISPDLYLSAGCTLKMYASVTSVLGVTISGVELT